MVPKRIRALLFSKLENSLFSTLAALLAFTFTALTSLCATTPPQYTLSIVSMFRNEASYLKEWVEYHKTVGVDHFWLYNDRSDDNWQAVLDPYIQEGLVEVIEWSLPPHIPSWAYWQVEAFRAGIENARGKTKWVAMVDIDEFIVPMRTKSIPECLDKYFTNASAVFANWKNFGTGGVTVQSGKPILSKLIASSYNHHSDNAIGKSIVRPEAVVIKDIWYPHHFPIVPGAKYLNGSGKEMRMQGIDLPTDGKHNADFIRINHYVLRDESFYHNVRLAKANRGIGDKTALLKHYVEFSLSKDRVIVRLLRHHYPEVYKRVWKE